MASSVQNLFMDLFLMADWDFNRGLLHNIDEFQALSQLPHQCIFLGSGPLVVLQEIKARLLPLRQVFVYSVYDAFDQVLHRDLLRCYARWSIEHISMGLSSTVVAHADCGGVILAVHYLCFCNIGCDGVVEVPCVPRCLAHIINAAEKLDAKGWWSAIDAPDNLVGPHHHRP
jgi:hypothetical protein